MFKETPIKAYLKRTLFLVIALCLALACFAPIAQQGAKQGLVYGIVFASVAGGSIIAYWIYIFIREYKISHRNVGKTKSSKESEADGK